MDSRYVICDFRAGTFFVHNGNGRPVFTPTSYRATQYESRIKARVKADALNAEHPEMDCDVITATAAWALERIQMRDSLLEAIAHDGA